MGESVDAAVPSTGQAVAELVLRVAARHNVSISPWAAKEIANELFELSAGTEPVAILSKKLHLQKKLTNKLNQRIDVLELQLAKQMDTIDKLKGKGDVLGVQAIADVFVPTSLAGKIFKALTGSKAWAPSSAQVYLTQSTGTPMEVNYKGPGSITAYKAEMPSQVVQVMGEVVWPSSAIAAASELAQQLADGLTEMISVHETVLSTPLIKFHKHLDPLKVEVEVSVVVASKVATKHPAYDDGDTKWNNS